MIKKREGNSSESIEKFDAALKLNPKFPQVYFERADAKRMVGDIDGAIEDYTKAIKLGHPEIAKAYSNRGLIKFERGDNNGAIYDYSTALDLDDSIPEIHYNLANCLQTHNLLEDSVHNYNRALALDENFEDCLYNRAIARKS